MGLFDSIVDGVSSVGRKIGGAVNSIGRKVAHTASKVGAKVGQAVKKVATAVIGKKATEKIEKVAGDVVEGVADVVKATPAILAELPKAGSKIVKRLQQGKGIGFGDVSKALAPAFTKLKGLVKPNSAIPAFVKEMARLALGAYKKTATVDGWKRDKEISNGKTSIYTKGNKVVISHRGTDTSDSQDMDADKDIVLGSFSETHPRVKRAKVIADKAKKKYKGFSFSQVAHSLGGAVMEELIKYGKGIGFNSGSSPAYNSFRSKPKNIDTYLIDGDFISVFNKSPKGVFKVKGNYSPHDIENFI